MTWLRRLIRPAQAGRLDGEVREELERHLELEIEERIRAGASISEARRTALRDFGAVDRWREEARASYRLSWLDATRQDLRYALRVLRGSPGFALAAVATLALAIGANTAVFSAVRGVLLRPLSFDQPDRLVRLYEHRAEDLSTGTASRGTISYLNFADLRARAALWQSASAFDEWMVTVSGAGDAVRLDGASVDWSWFDVLGVEPAAGRFFAPSDSAAGNDRLVVLSWDLWQTRYGGNRDLVGGTITVNGQPYEVIGVAPRGLESPELQGAFFDAPVLWRPPQPYFLSNSRGARSFTALIRLRPGVTLERAQTELDALEAQLVEQYPENNAGRVARLVPLHSDVTGASSAALWLTLAAAGVVLLVACVNVANLLLLRAAARDREVSLRAALGASRARVARQLLTESLVLAMLGGVAGVALAYALMPVLSAVAAEQLPRAEQIRVDGVVLAFSAVLSVMVGVVFGLAPMVQLARVAPGAALRSAGRVAGGPRGLRHFLLATEVALCVLALASAGLLTRTLLQLRAVDPGVTAENVLTMELQPTASYADDRYPLLHEELRRRISTLAGVKAVGAVSILPMSGSFNGVGYSIEGEPPPAPGDAPSAEARAVTPELFDALGIPLLAGRPLTHGDGPDSDLVAVVSRSFALRHAPTVDAAIGRTIMRNEYAIRIVGVVGDVHQFTLDQMPEPTIYLPDAQGVESMSFRFRLVVRADRDPLVLLPAIRSIVRDIDPLMPLARVERMAEVVGGTYAAQRSRSLLFSGFAGLTLLLAIVGVYGTVAYDIARRRQEIGVRMALGASRGGVSMLLLRQSLRPVLAGALAGIAIAIAAGRVLAGFLFDVSAADPVALGSAPFLLLVTAGVAAWWPARRAAGVPPGIVLRED